MSLLPVGKEHPYYRLIGIFWLRAGDDRLDVLFVRRIDAEFRRLLRCRSRFNSVDDNCRAVLAGTEAGRHVHCGSRQLDRQLPRRYWIP